MLVMNTFGITCNILNVNVFQSNSVYEFSCWLNLKRQKVYKKSFCHLPEAISNSDFVRELRLQEYYHWSYESEIFVMAHFSFLSSNSQLTFVSHPIQRPCY